MTRRPNKTKQLGSIGQDRYDLQMTRRPNKTKQLESIGQDRYN